MEDKQYMDYIHANAQKSNHVVTFAVKNEPKNIIVILTSEATFALSQLGKITVKMFVIAGPIIVAGTVSSVVSGVIYWIIGLFN